MSSCRNEGNVFSSAVSPSLSNDFLRLSELFRSSTNEPRRRRISSLHLSGLLFYSIVRNLSKVQTRSSKNGGQLKQKGREWTSYDCCSLYLELHKSYPNNLNHRRPSKTAKRRAWHEPRKKIQGRDSRRTSKGSNGHSNRFFDTIDTWYRKLFGIVVFPRPISARTSPEWVPEESSPTSLTAGEERRRRTDHTLTGEWEKRENGGRQMKRRDKYANQINGEYINIHAERRGNKLNKRHNIHTRTQSRDTD